jgi:hypothetical protein
MNRTRKARERLKNILIIVLIITAVFLGWQSRLFGNNAADPGALLETLSRLGVHNKLGSGEAIQSPGASKPIGIAVTDNSEKHFGVRYDMSVLNTVYNRAVLVMGDAFGSASSPRLVDESTWRSALLSQGIYFEYLAPVEISILDGWFGTQINGEWGGMQTRRLCVADTNGRVKLYFEQYGTGHFYAADTEVGAGSVAMTDAFGVNGAVFAFELGGETAARDKYALMITGEAAHPVILANNPLRDNAVLTQAISTLGITDQPSYPYSGAVNYIDNDFMLTVDTDGTVLYRLRSGGSGTGQPLGKSQAVELARQTVADSIGKFCGDAAVYFDTVSTISGGYQVTFRYVVAGGVVQLYQDGLAATVTIRNGVISEMELRFRSYTVSGVNKKLLPEIQVTAIAAGPFILSYPDNGGDSLEPCWTDAPAYPS